MTIARADVLSLLASRTCAPSAEEPEGMLASVEVIRCADELALISETRADLPSLVRLQRATSERQGVLVVQCLRAYEEHKRGTGLAQERALAAVYEWARGHAPALYPTALHTEQDLPGAFARGKAAIARSKAADLYADCFLVLAEFVAAWNRRQIRSVA